MERSGRKGEKEKDRRRFLTVRIEQVEIVTYFRSLRWACCCLTTLRGASFVKQTLLSVNTPECDEQDTD
jgi:hypothetical protein